MSDHLRLSVVVTCCCGDRRSSCVRVQGFSLLPQETPDAPEALRCMPSLQLSDIPKRTTSIPTATAEELGVQLLRHELFTNDVLYVEAALDMHSVPASLLHLMPLFCRCGATRAQSTSPSAQSIRRRAFLGLSGSFFGTLVGNRALRTVWGLWRGGTPPRIAASLALDAPSPKPSAEPWYVRRALTQMGTEKESFVELTERINRTTGGVSVYPFTSPVRGSPEPVAFLMVSFEDCRALVFLTSTKP